MDNQSHHSTPQPDDLPRNGDAPASQPEAPVPQCPIAVPNCPIYRPESSQPSPSPSRTSLPFTLAWDEMGQSGTENKNSLSPKQAAAIPHVAASPSLTAGAKAAGVGRSTLNRWINEPQFRAELERARQDVAELAYSEIQALALKCVSRLSTLLDSPNDHVSASAIRTALRLLRQIDADRNIQNRLDILDNALALIKEQR